MWEDIKGLSRRHAADRDILNVGIFIFERKSDLAFHMNRLISVGGYWLNP